VLYVFVRYAVKPGMRDEYIAAIKGADISKRTMEEPGNYGYEFFSAIEDENTLFLLECWENEEALVPHRDMEHYKQMQDFKAKFVLDTAIKIVKVAE